MEACLASEGSSVVQLSAQLKISSRTLFREFKDIEQILKKFGLVLSRKKQVNIIGTPEQLLAFKQELKMQDIQILTKEERQDLLTYEILKSKKLEKILYYANTFQVSEATISNDLNVVEKWFAKQGLHLRRKSGAMIELIGDEVNYRKALSLIISTNIQNRAHAHDSKQIIQLLFNDEYASIMQLLNKEVIQQILNVLDANQETLQLHKYAQTSYVGLIIHLSVAIDRILKNEEIEENQFAISLMEHEESYAQALLMSQYLEESFHIHIPKQETAYIAMHMQGAKLNVYQDDLEVNEDMDYDKQLLDVVHQMIDNFDCTYNIKDDAELVRSLLVHLKPTLIRIKYDMPIFNPLLDDIKVMYPQLFEATKEACRIIEQTYDVTLHDTEIGFMTMHFGAAQERRKHQKQTTIPLKVGVVCSSGIGVSALLSVRIKQICDQSVEVESYSIQEMMQVEQELDIIISTFNLDNYTNKSITINPLLKQEDVTIILAEMKAARVKKQMASPPKQNDDFEVIHAVSGEIMYLLSNLCIETFTAIQDAQDLIKQAVQTLNLDEARKQSIEEALIIREQMESMVYPDLGLALIHTKCDSVTHCIVKVLRMKQSEALQNISFGLLMLMPDQDNRIIAKMMGKISSNLLEDQQFYEILKQGSQNEVYAVMKEKLKTYLQSL